MIGLFTCLSASKLCTLYIKASETRNFKVEIDDNKKVSAVYNLVSKKLNIPESKFRITMKGRNIYRCRTLIENDVHDGDHLSLKFGNFPYKFPKSIEGKSAKNKLYTDWDDGPIGEPWGHGHRVFKPIIYIYPTEEIDATVSLKTGDEFIAVYPAFSNEKDSEWKVHAHPSGKIEVAGREYTSLFWESDGKTFTPQFETGFIVTKENAVAFLEEKLRLLGLTDLEANEFITFWLPKLNTNGKSVVSFQFDNYDKNYPLTVSPKPDTIIRVFLAIRKAEENEQIKEQELPTFKRQGYTVIEWGGTAV